MAHDFIHILININMIDILYKRHFYY